MTYDQNSNIEIVHADGHKIVAIAKIGDKCVKRYVPLTKHVSTGYNSMEDYKNGKSVSFTEYGAWYRSSNERPISFPLTAQGLIAAKRFVEEHSHS
jgi:hypothetical protein